MDWINIIMGSGILLASISLLYLTLYPREATIFAMFLFPLIGAAIAPIFITIGMLSGATIIISGLRSKSK